MQIVAFKTDSVFIIDPNDEFTKLVTDYFTKCGFKSKVFKYSKFMHARSRKSENDVSFYIGRHIDGSIESNGIVEKC